MGTDRIRHLVDRRTTAGKRLFFWQPSKSLVDLGMSAEALGADEARARARAIELNAISDQIRNGVRDEGNDAKPGTLSRLFSNFKGSDEFAQLGQRTRKDYAYYIGKIEEELGHIMVRSITARGVKIYYQRVRRDRGVTWSYHILATLRAALTWGVTEDWISSNPALEVTIKSPPKRTVTWSAEQAEAYISKARELGWHSIAAMAQVFDSTAQSPIDVRTLKRGSYDGRTISNVRSKTGVTDAPIPLFPEAKRELDAYLATKPPGLPEAPLFTNDRIGSHWVYSTLCKIHNEIRTAAGLPKKLQLQDFRRTAQTEAGAAGATADEIRGLARHTTRSAAEHYVHPDARFVESAQAKRLEKRRRTPPA